MTSIAFTNTRRWLTWAIVAILVFGSLIGLARPANAEAAGFNTPGNVLIADQFNNRVIEVNPATHQIVWQFGTGSPVAGPNTTVGPNDAERVGNLTLIASTGIPAGVVPSLPNGAPDSRVMLVNQAGQIVWQYGKAGVPGMGFNRLNTPVQATYLPNGDILITDQANARVIEVNRAHVIVWQYGITGVAGNGFDKLNNPNSAELLANGNILIADEGNNRVIEVTRAHTIVWKYGNVSNTSILNQPAFASRLPNGNTLITDGGNNRILEVTPMHMVVWSYVTNTRPGSIADPLPSRAVRLADGRTLISDQFNNQVIAVNNAGTIVFAQGQVAVAGNGFDQLYAPYDAKVIGDYTGLTPPF